MDSLGIIIPAAGKGQRIGGRVPKPFIEIGEDPVIVHTIRQFLQFDAVEELVIACAESRLDETRTLLDPLKDGERVELNVVKGGATRQQSVFNALETLSSPELVAVHDAVRPFVSQDQLRRCYRKARETGGAILGIPVSDTIKLVDENYSIRKTPDRHYLWQAQTPQIFRSELLRKAYRKAINENYTGTDDASLVERLGHPVYIVEGSRDNFKITYPEDLRRAAQILTKNS